MSAKFSLNFDEPIVGTAIHNGHKVRKFTLDNLAISDFQRFYEEDPFTDFFIENFNNKIIVDFSRFEVDLNRSREHCVYLNPEDAWGLKVRKEKVPDNQIEKSLEIYDDFYRRAKLFFDELVFKYGYFFVYDVHSYNHRRNGKNAPIDDPKKNPEIIIGTSNMNPKFIKIAEIIQNSILSESFLGRKLDARINVKFSGGNFARWIHKNYTDTGICISLEFKKIFMNEWTSEIYCLPQYELRKILENTLFDINLFLKRIKSSNDVID
jgi:hypothetical protein